jgi:hypothetical protein
MRVFEEMEAGLQILARFPEPVQGRFSHLVHHPSLVMEMLLMNQKFELAGHVFSELPRIVDRQLITEYAHRTVRVGANRRQSTMAAFVAAGDFPLAWILTAEQDKDSETRKQHFYAQSPSLDLAKQCLLILPLAADRAEVCLEVCKRLLGSLSPKAADSFAVLSKLAEELILFAQSQCHEAQPVAQSGRARQIGLAAFCVKLLDLLGLLCRLVSCGITDVTIKDLESGRARSLRDRLIGEDQMQLALEVASKCSIETEPVWLRWTTSLLRMAQYEQAHIQYRSFVQPFSERPYSSPDHPPIAEVDALLRALEDAPPIYSQKVQELHRHLTEAVHSDLNSSAEARELTILPVASIFMSDEKRLNATSTLDIVRFRECTYLVEMYGSPIQQIRFLLRHDLLRDACSIAASCNLPPACFVTEIGVHCLNRGLLAVLQSTLVSLEQRDAAVVQGFHLAMCRRLNENKCFRQLYSLQIHMGDLLRAGLTSVLLFSQSKDTASRIQNLERARENLQRGLMQFQGGKSVQVAPSMPERRKACTSSCSSCPARQCRNHSGSHALAVD